MTNAVSRILVALIGVPVVLGVVYLGGWWVFASRLWPRWSRCTSTG